MGRKIFISKSYYDKYKKFKCPLQTGYWHYSPNGCCIFINEKTNTIHHLYMRESCSLTKYGTTIQQLLDINEQACEDEADNDDDGNNNQDDVDADDEYDEFGNVVKTGRSVRDDRFLTINLQPYLNNATIYNIVDQTVLNGLNEDARLRVLQQHDEILQQYWFIMCDTRVEYESMRKSVSETEVQNIVLKNLFGPLIFCASVRTLSNFLTAVTNRFIFRQMPIINNMPADRVMAKLLDNIKFIKQFPAQRMLQFQPSNSLFYMDARDLFDIVKLSRNSEYFTNMRTVHLTNEINFLDTWRRIIFNLVHELVNIHTFDRQRIRIGSTCNAVHFLKGNNKTVLPEFRCNVDNKSRCVHLMQRRKEYEMLNNQAKAVYTIDNQQLNHTIELSDKGVICKFVLETMVDEYGRDAVDAALNFSCMFSNTVFEHTDASLWEHAIYETLGIDNRLRLKDGSAVSRERIACMQELCGEKRMNDIHRFCLPKRFLTLAWFKWACDELKLKVFDQD